SAHSNLLFSLNYDPALDPEKVFLEHRVWASRASAGLPRAHSNDRNPERRLRIGYLSPDFRGNAVSFFIAPVLARHDRGRFEVHCYPDVELEDALTARLKSYAERWHGTAWLSNEALAERIRADGIDILVDLTGHTWGGARMPLFARKPAPVQATWLGYLNT